MKIDVDTNPAISGQRIFLVDRDVVNRSTLYFMISDDNEIYEFESVAEIADMSSHLAPDLVIVNALLVAEHGKALIQRWRMVWPQVKVVMICEACDMECVTAAKAAGADDTLQRPFRQEEVKRKAARWAESGDTPKIPNKAQGTALHA